MCILVRYVGHIICRAPHVCEAAHFHRGTVQRHLFCLFCLQHFCVYALRKENTGQVQQHSNKETEIKHHLQTI